MDDAVAMREFQRQAALERDFHNAIDRQQVGDIAELLECRPVDILHDDIAVFVERVGIVDRHDVGMDEFAHQRGFVQEHLVKAPPQVCVDPVRRAHYFDGDVAVGERIASQIDAAGAAAPELADYRVLADFGWK